MTDEIKEEALAKCENCIRLEKQLEDVSNLFFEANRRANNYLLGWAWEYHASHQMIDFGTAARTVIEIERKGREAAEKKANMVK